MTNVDLIKQGYSNFATGNVEAVWLISTLRLSGTNARGCQVQKAMACISGSMQL